MVKSRLAIALVLVLSLGLLIPAESEAFVGLPPGFVDEPVLGGVPVPTSFDWLPDGSLLVTSQNGILYRSSGGGPPQPVLDLTGIICAGGEMGLLGLAIDPSFGSGERFVYLYYTYQRGGAGCANPENRANRVSRFSIDGNFTAGGERVLIDNIPATGMNHNGGDLQFDRNRLLYIAVGDAGADVQTGQREPNNGNARRLDLLSGKILRIERDGGIPPGNPFDGGKSGRCRASGQLKGQSADTRAEKKGKKKGKQKRRDKRGPKACQEIFATGLRNPFRIAFDPNDRSRSQRFFINDVGGGAWEEIDAGRPGADYGWPIREGPCPFGTTDTCGGDGRFVAPVFAYPHSTGCRTITGGAFVPNNGNWPDSFDGVYLYADLACNQIFAYRGQSPGQTPETFASGTGAIHLRFGGDGALYYSTFEGGGQIRRIVFAG